MKKAIAIFATFLFVFSLFAVLPVPVHAETAQHELIDSSNITEDANYYYIHYGNNVIQIAKTSMNIWLCDGSTYFVTNIAPKLQTETSDLSWENTALTYDSTTQTFTYTATNTTTNVKVTEKIVAYSDRIWVHTAISQINDKVLVYGLHLNFQSSTQNFEFWDYGLMQTKTVQYTYGLQHNFKDLTAAFGVSDGTVQYLIYENQSDYSPFNVLYAAGLYSYFGWSGAKFLWTVYSPANSTTEVSKQALMPISSVSYNIEIFPMSLNEPIQNKIPLKYPNAYARDATVTFTFDDGPPTDTLAMDESLYSLFTSHNIYYSRYIWWKFETENGQLSSIYTNTSYAKFFKNAMAHGVVVGMHSPTYWSDTTSNFTSAIADWKTVFGSEGFHIYQPHGGGSNLETYKKYGTDPNSQYYSQAEISNNFEFYEYSALFYDQPNPWDEVDGTYVSPAMFNSTSVDFGHIKYVNRYWVWEEPLYRSTNSTTGHSGVTFKNITDLMHNILVYHANIAIYDHMHEAYFLNAQGQVEPWIYSNGTVTPYAKYIVELISQNHTRIWTPNPYTYYKYWWAIANLEVNTYGNILQIRNPTQYSIDGMSVIVPSYYKSAYINGKEVPVVQKDGFNVVVFSIGAGQTLTIQLSKNTPSFQLLSANIGEQHVNMYRDGNTIYVKVTGHGTGQLKLKVPWTTANVATMDIAGTGNIITLNIQAGHTYEIESITTHSMKIAIDWSYAIIGLMVPLIIFGVMFQFLGEFMNTMKRMIRFGRK